MKFKVSSYSLLKQLSSLSGVISNGATLPICECFLFVVNKNELRITATDLETTMSSSVEIESKDSGDIAIPARILLDTLKAFPNQPLTFTTNEKFGIEISSDNGKYKLTGYNGADFPKTIELDKPSSFEIEANVLSSIISKTIFATGSDDLRPVMMGVFVKVEKDGITFVSTDAQKMVKCKDNNIKSKSECSYIIPKKPLNLIRNAMGNGKVKVEYNATNVVFTSGSVTIVSRLIDGKYPNYDAVIPTNNPNLLTIDRAEFLSSIKRVSVFSNKTTHQIKLSLKKNKLSIDTEDKDFSNEATESLKCEYKGEDLDIAFNSKYLSEILSNIEEEEVVMELAGPNKAGVVKPVKGQQDLLMLLMPVMINN